jgi:acetyl esterase/lipase
MKLVHSEYVSPCSPRVLKRWGHMKQDLEGKHEDPFRREIAAVEAARALEAKAVANLDMDMGKDSNTTHSVYSPDARNGDASDHAERQGAQPDVAADRSQFKLLFEGFPRTLIVVGDAERLVTEIKYLQDAMKKDGVDVQAEWVRDAVHDILLINQWWWDWGVVNEVWRVVGDWAARVKG